MKYKECLRLRHYSYSTEKTYLECIGKFADYIRKDNVLDISDDDVRNYMACLAVKQMRMALRRNE